MQSRSLYREGYARKRLAGAADKAGCAALDSYRAAGQLTER